MGIEIKVKEMRINMTDGDYKQKIEEFKKLFYESTRNGTADGEILSLNLSIEDGLEDEYINAIIAQHDIIYKSYISYCHFGVDVYDGCDATLEDVLEQFKSDIQLVENNIKDSLTLDELKVNLNKLFGNIKDGAK